MENNLHSSRENCHCVICQGICPCNGVEKYFERYYQLQVPITSEAKQTLIYNLLHKYSDQDAFFESPDWKPEIFSQLETELYQAKSLLNSFGVGEWNGVTYRIDISVGARKHTKSLFGPLSRHTLTITWSKLRELLVKYHDDLFRPCIISEMKNDESSSPKFNTLHLCEMPGSFVRSLRFYIKENFPNVQHEWLATSLNHYHEQYDVLSAEFVNYRNISQHDYKNWLFFDSDKGDLLNSKELSAALTDEEDMNRKTIVREHFDLITCDGGISCEHDPAKQEKNSFPLKFAEVITALSALKPSGCLIVKFYTLFECSTISLVYILYLLFEKVHITKPFTSKHGNSEVYFVCLNYRSTEQISQKALRLFLDNAMRHIDGPNSSKENGLLSDCDVDQKFLETLHQLEKQINANQSRHIQQSVQLAEHISKSTCCSLNLERIRQETVKLFIEKAKLNIDLLEEVCKHYDKEVMDSILNFEHENFLENPLSVAGRMIHGKPIRRLKYLLNHEERVRLDNWNQTRYAFDLRSLPKIISDFELAKLCQEIFGSISHLDADVSKDFMNQKSAWLNLRFVDVNTIDFKSIRSSKFADINLLNLWMNLKLAHERLFQTEKLRLRPGGSFGPLKLSENSTFRNHSFTSGSHVLGVSIKNQLFRQLLRSSKSSLPSCVYHTIEWSDALSFEKKTIEEHTDIDDESYNVGMSTSSCILGSIKQISHLADIYHDTIRLDEIQQDTNLFASLSKKILAKGSFIDTTVHIVPIEENKDDGHYHDIHDEWLICNKLVSTLTKLLRYELDRENSDSVSGDTILVFTLPHTLTRAIVGLLFLLHNALFRHFAIVPRIPFYSRQRLGSDGENWRDRNQPTITKWDSDISLNQFVILRSSTHDKGHPSYKSNLEETLLLLNDVEDTVTNNPNMRLLELVSTPHILMDKSFYQHIYAANFVRTLIESYMIRSTIYDNFELFKEMRSNDPNFVPHLILSSEDTSNNNNSVN